jgi:outer membrane protein assembly factor BamB
MHNRRIAPSHVAGILGGIAVSTAALAAGGEVVWSRGFTAPQGAATPRTGADGNLYWAAGGLLHKATPQGQIIWLRAGTDDFALASDRIYLAGTSEGPSPLNAVRAITTGNQLLWEYTNLAGIQGFIGGPDVGPDGNIYATADGPTNGPGTFSLTPLGALRWNLPNFNNRAGTPPSRLVFTSQLVFKGENTIPPPPNGLGSGLIAMHLGGGTAWINSYDVPASISTGPGRQPRVNPVSGQVNTARWFTNDIVAYRPDGTMAWSYPATRYGYSLSEVDVGPDGSIYVINGDRDMIALTAGGQVRWIAPQVVPGVDGGAFATSPTVSPDGHTVVFATTACYGYTCPGSLVALNAGNGTVRWSVPLTDPSGTPSVRSSPSFSPDSSLVYAAAEISAGASRLYALCVSGACPPPCGSADFNCDGDAGTDADIESFFACLSGTCPSAPCTASADFNGDGDAGTDSDIEAFFRVLAGGTC